MSVNLESRQNKGLLVALVVGTVVALAGGIMWLQGRGTTLIEELAYVVLVLVAALYVYDRLLVM